MLKKLSDPTLHRAYEHALANGATHRTKDFMAGYEGKGAPWAHYLAGYACWRAGVDYRRRELDKPGKVS